MVIMRLARDTPYTRHGGDTRYYRTSRDIAAHAAAAFLRDLALRRRAAPSCAAAPLRDASPRCAATSSQNSACARAQSYRIKHSASRHPRAALRARAYCASRRAVELPRRAVTLAGKISCLACDTRTYVRLACRPHTCHLRREASAYKQGGGSRKVMLFRHTAWRASTSPSAEMEEIKRDAYKIFAAMSARLTLLRCGGAEGIYRMLRLLRRSGALGRLAWRRGRRKCMAHQHGSFNHQTAAPLASENSAYRSRIRAAASRRRGKLLPLLPRASRACCGSNARTQSHRRMPLLLVTRTCLLRVSRSWRRARERACRSRSYAPLASRRGLLYARAPAHALCCAPPPHLALSHRIRPTSAAHAGLCTQRGCHGTPGAQRTYRTGCSAARCLSASPYAPRACIPAARGRLQPAGARAATSALRTIICGGISYAHAQPRATGASWASPRANAFNAHIGVKHYAPREKHCLSALLSPLLLSRARGGEVRICVLRIRMPPYCAARLCRISHRRAAWRAAGIRMPRRREKALRIYILF